MIRKVVLLTLIAPAGLCPGVASANCDDGSPYFEFHNSLVKKKPTDLHTDWVRGPADVSLTKGRSGESSVSFSQESGGVSLEADFKAIKLGWNSGHSGMAITRSVSGTVSETVTYHVPRHRTARVIMFRAKLVTTAIKYKTGPGCRPVEIGRARVAAPLADTQFVIKRQFLQQV